MICSDFESVKFLSVIGTALRTCLGSLAIFQIYVTCTSPCKLDNCGKRKV